ncbi:MAG: hypothetical protein GY867_10930 [bacterium]|nr:hypothetical protein [bacterium]
MTDRAFLRHTLATLAYRAAKTLRGVPDSFAEFKLDENSNTPQVVVCHMANLMAWMQTMIQGQPKWVEAPMTDWTAACSRFFDNLKKVDDLLASDIGIAFDLKLMFQAPVADALTHVGQLAMLRRLSGSKMKSEVYLKADIQIGRVGPDQTPIDPEFEFD